MSLAAFTETVLRRDRSVVLAGLGSIVLLSWAYIIYLARDMASMMDMSNANLGMGMAMPAVQPWGAVDYVLMFIMWSVMMFAMMTPSAAPMVLTYTKISRQRQSALKPVWGTTVFFLGYLLVWTAFSAVATLAQGGLHAATLLSPMMETTSPDFGRHHPRCRRRFPVYAAQVCLPVSLSHAAGLFHDRMARRQMGSFGYGRASWRLLCWLLLADYGLALCSRCHELVLDCRHRGLCFGGKSAAGRSQSKLGIGALMIGWGIWMIASVLL